MGGSTCEECGAAVAQGETETTAAAVRRHAGEAGHAPASVRRERPDGIVQRWRTEAERDIERARAREAAKRHEREQQAAAKTNAGNTSGTGWVVHTRQPGRWRQRWVDLALSARVCIALGVFVFALSMGSWLVDEPTGPNMCEVPRNDGSGLVRRDPC